MRVGAYGDILMGSPVLSALRDAYPNAHITWVVEPGGSPIIAAHPDIDDLLLWHGTFFKQLKRYLFFPFPVVAYHSIKLWKEIKKRDYDIFICYQPEEWPLFTKIVNAKTSIGIFDTFRRYYKAQRSSQNTKLFSHAITFSDLPPHRIDQYAMALKALGIEPLKSKKMSMGYMAEDRIAAETWLKANGFSDNERPVLIAPSTTWPTKCWPIERYSQLADKLSELGKKVILIGSAKECDALQKVAKDSKSDPIILAGELTISAFAALVDRSDLVVSGDTGPMHIAASLSTPYVAIFGPTSPEWYGPLDSVGIHLSCPPPCGPCDQKKCDQQGDNFLRCQKDISVETVFKACVKLL
jgi:heptosyltransferase-1